MITFRRLTMLFFIILLGMNLSNLFPGKFHLDYFREHEAMFYALLVSSYFGISFAMAFLPCSGFHHKVICHGNTTEKWVAITFDDGPDPLKTPVILDILQRHGIKATFFCIGKNIEGNELLATRIHENGHLIGNHSFSHSRWFDLFPARKMRGELAGTDNLVHGITGKTPLFFRPPFGVVNPMVSNALKKMHWHAICWNIRSFDTMEKEPRKTMQRITGKLKPGAIILLHDFTPFTEHHLDDLICGIIEKGYSIVPLDQMLNLPAYA
ncbi:MAG: polysaccharide deacetylase family protein [Bacteroidota bacterium]